MPRSRFRPSPAMVVACTSLVLSTGGVTYAATGGTFVLGSANKAGDPTTLTSRTAAGSSLVVNNKGGRPAASFKSQEGAPPFAVDQDAKVHNLNVDLLDGVDASSFVRADEEVPSAEVYNAAQQPAETVTSLDLVASAEIFDHGDLWSGGGDPRSFTISTPGTYVVAATVHWESNGSGYRRVDLQTSDAGIIGTAVGPAGPTPALTAQNVTGISHFDAGDTVRVTVLQGSGTTVNARLMRFQIAYVGR